MSDSPAALPATSSNDLGLGPMVVAVTWVFTVLAMIAVLLWVYARKKQRLPLGWDVWLMIISMIIRFASQVGISVSLKYGLGKHDKDLTPDELVMILKYNWSTLPGGTVNSVLARLSITILLIRLFGVHKRFKWFLIGLMVVQIVLSIIFIPMTFCQIKPVEALWNVFMKPERRWDPRIWLYTAYLLQSVWTFSDLMYVLLPVSIIWKLQMPLRQKIGLMLLMCVSLFTMTMSILKTIWVAAASKATQYSVDVQYHAMYQVLFSVLEMDFVIMMGCVPSLRSLVGLEMDRVSSLWSSLRNFGKKDSTNRSSSERSYDTGRDERKGSDHSSDTERGDEDFATVKSGHVGKNGSNGDIVISVRPQHASHHTLVTESQITRTDQWDVSSASSGDVRFGRENV